MAKGGVNTMKKFIVYNRCSSPKQLITEDLAIATGLREHLYRSFAIKRGLRIKKLKKSVNKKGLN